MNNDIKLKNERKVNYVEFWKNIFFENFEISIFSLEIMDLVDNDKLVSYIQEKFIEEFSENELIDILANEVGKTEQLVEILDEFNIQVRICSECGEIMKSGYITADFDYYCSDDCLHKHYTDEEWQKLYEENPDDYYYTEW